MTEAHFNALTDIYSILPPHLIDESPPTMDDNGTATTEERQRVTITP